MKFLLGIVIGWTFKVIWDSGIVGEAWSFCVSKDARRIGQPPHEPWNQGGPVRRNDRPYKRNS